VKAYLDNAATTYRRPESVLRAVSETVSRLSCNPGRSGYAEALEAGEMVWRVRTGVAEFFGVKDASGVVFCRNATEAVNLALRGLDLRPPRVLTTSMEHNCVMRTLNDLRLLGRLDYDVVSASDDGTLEAEAFEDALRSGDYGLVVVNHISNVVGTIAPLAGIGAACAKAGVPLLVDAAQSAGTVPVDMERMGISLLAFTSHKGLLGIQGAGGLVMSDAALGGRIKPLVTGGTGSRSAEETQPEFLPDRLESGTLPLAPLASLEAGIRHLRETGMEKVEAHKRRLTALLIERLSAVDGVRLYGPGDRRQVAVVGFTLRGTDGGELAQRLWDAGVACRVGLHCAPSAHRTIGTYPNGTVRFSIGLLTTEREIEYAAEVVARIARE